MKEKITSKITHIIQLVCIILFLFVIIFPNSQVQAASFFDTLDGVDGYDDSSAGPASKKPICSIGDIYKTAQKKPARFYSEEMLTTLGRNVTPHQHEIEYAQPNCYCMDNHDYTSYGGYGVAVFNISAIIDVNINGDGKVVVHKKGGDTEISITSSAAKYLYAAAQAASEGGKESVQQCLVRAYNANSSALPSGFSRVYAQTDYDAEVSAKVKSAYLKYKGRFIFFDGIAKNSSSTVLQSQIVYRGDKSAPNLEIKKVDSTDSSKTLKGAKFKIYNKTVKMWLAKNNTLVKTTQEEAYAFTTTSGGLITRKEIPAGEYVAYEVEPPSGYEKISTPIPLVVNKTNVITNEPKSPPPPEDDHEDPKPTLGDGLVKVIEVNGKESDYPVEGLKFGIKYWEPDNKEYKVDGKREPQTSDSKYWGYVYHSSGYWKYYDITEWDEEKEEWVVIGQDRKWVDTSYYTYEYLYPERYKADHDEWVDWKNGNDYYHDSQVNYKAIATSDSSGKISLTGFRTDGSYTLYEIGSENPYFEVEGAPKEIMKEYRNTTQKIISNKRTYVDIEGNVFLDGQEGKQSVRNNEFDGEEGINGVKVTLKKGGEILSIASGTDSKGGSCATGHYKFWGDKDNLKIKTEDLSQYTIEFEYNGLKYESVATTNIGKGNGSKAIEDSSKRTSFNNGYSQITGKDKISGGKSSNLSSNNGETIDYKSEGHVSEVIYKSSDSRYDDKYYADDKYHIQASTRTAGLDLSQTGEIGGYPYDPTKDAIEDINFGIYEREQPDIAIASDLHAIETSINGYSQIYRYQKRYGVIDDESAYEIEIKSSDAEYNSSYERGLYESDVSYTASTNNGSELAVYLTYKIAIKNQSSSINANVIDIVEYFKNNLKDNNIVIGKDIQTLSDTALSPQTNDRRLLLTNSDGMSIKDAGSEGEYSKKYITLNKEIEAGYSYEFYIQFEMKKEAILSIPSGGVYANNVVELNTCSAKENGTGKVWTAVDMDSAVGNCMPNSKETMEDDTDYAPNVRFYISGERRQITGIVFEDSTSSDLKTNETRNSDGLYDATREKGISNVKIELVNIDTGTTAYSSSGSAFTITNTGGIYTLSDFIPGNYIVKYTYGKDTGQYTAQQYKSTIYKEQNRTRANYSEYQGICSYPSAKWYLNGSGTRLSDAVDNYQGEIEEKYGNISGLTKNRMEIDSTWNETDGMQHFYNGTEINKDLEIDAYTPYMAIPVVSNTISNIDFGIAERARSRVQIDKVINRIQLVQTDGSILRDFTNFDNLPANTKAIKSTRTVDRGFVQFEIDTELLQTTTLLVEYGFKATNQSEIDYQDEAYYKYGTEPTGENKENTIVRLTVASIIDYVDNELLYNANSHMISEGNTDKTNAENEKWTIEDVTKEENKKYLSEDIRKQLYENGKCKYTTILIGKGLDEQEKSKMLKPGESNTIGLLLNKTLSPTKEKMHYDNVAEIVEIKKTWGREIYGGETRSGAGDNEKIGNLDPTDENQVIKTKDPDSNYSEKIIINPPTGQNRNITIYTIMGITCLIILASGIIFIKKKIIEK